jgi:hypothetical protein
VNEEWLATGRGHLHPCLEFAASDCLKKVRRRALFSELFDEVLAPEVNARYEALAKAGRLCFHTTAEWNEIEKRIAVAWVRGVVGNIPAERVRDFLVTIQGAGSEFLKRNAISLDGWDAKVDLVNAVSLFGPEKSSVPRVPAKTPATAKAPR